MSHEWSSDREQNYLQDLLNKGSSVDSVSRALAKDAVAHDQEFVLMKTLIPFDYQINAQGRWTDEGGKTIEEVTDPNAVGADRLGRVLLAESGLMNNPNVTMAAVASPDLGYGRDYVYLYSRGEGNTIKALAIEFHGQTGDLQQFFTQLGVRGGADVSESDNFEKPLFFTQTITPAHILEEAKNSLYDSEESNEYFKRLSRDVTTYPLILEERDRQVEHIANAALEHMLAEETVMQGLAAAVYGAIELSRETAETTVTRVMSYAADVAEDIAGYVQKEWLEKDEGISVVDAPVTQAVHTISELLLHTGEEDIVKLTVEPRSTGIESMSVSQQEAQWKEVAMDILHINEKQADDLVTDVQEAWKIMETHKHLIEDARESGVGVAGALFLLATWTEQEESALLPAGLTHQDQRVKSRISADEDALNVTQALIESMQIEDRNISILEEQQYENHEVHQGIDVFMSIRFEGLIKKLETVSSEKQHELITEERESVDDSIFHIWEMIQEVFSDGSSSHEAEGATIHSPSETISIFLKETVEKEEQPLKDFRFAVGIFFLLKLFQYRASLDVLALFLQSEQQEQTSDIAPEALSMRIQKEKPEGLIQKESAPWILYAIIWYLAMIREQGKATSNTKTTKKKKKSKNIAISGASGVIFAFNS
jgi:hypothetical protein